MLDSTHRLARRLLPIRPVLIGLVACGLLGAAIGVFAFAGNEGDYLLMPAMILVLWSVTGLIFIEVFAQLSPPPHANPNIWSRRWASKLRKGFRWALVLGFVVLGLTAVDLSLHIADAWLMDGSR
jgi:hypothetical protein